MDRQLGSHHASLCFTRNKNLLATKYVTSYITPWRDAHNSKKSLLALHHKLYFFLSGQQWERHLADSPPLKTAKSKVCLVYGAVGLCFPSADEHMMMCYQNATISTTISSEKWKYSQTQRGQMGGLNVIERSFTFALTFFLLQPDYTKDFMFSLIG